MSNNVSIWMPLYVKDYIADTQRLSTIEHGAYLLLIMDYWISGRLEDNDEELARIAKLSLEKWRKIRPKILLFFVRSEGQLLHPRIEQELEISRKSKLDAKVRAAKGGAATKAYWAKLRKTNGKA